jgi:nucleoside-diphosphate-sugar epimerase
MKTLLLGGGGFLGKALTTALYRNRDLVVATSQSNLKVPFGVRTMYVSKADHLHFLSDSVLEDFQSVIDCSWEGLPDLGAHLSSKNLASKLDLIRRIANVGGIEYNGFGSCLEYGSLLGEVDEAAIGTRIGDFGLAKLAILRELRELNLPYRWFRPFYLVGFGQHANSLFHSAYKDISNGVEFLPRSHPSSAFDFLDISDFALGVNSAVISDSVWGVINVGSGRSSSIEEVANQFRNHFGIEQRLVEKQDSMVASTTKLSRATGWKPILSLPQMVTKFISDMVGDSD